MARSPQNTTPLLPRRRTAEARALAQLRASDEVRQAGEAIAAAVESLRKAEAILTAEGLHNGTGDLQHFAYTFSGSGDPECVPSTQILALADRLSREGEAGRASIAAKAAR